MDDADAVFATLMRCFMLFSDCLAIIYIMKLPFQMKWGSVMREMPMHAINCSGRLPDGFDTLRHLII